MSSNFGENLKITVFGQSHSAAVGVTLDGFPVGFEIDFEALKEFMQRRAPGGELSTQRHEKDEIEFLSGVTDGKTNGAPICAIIRNTDVRSGDYAAIADTPRPSHADYVAFVKYGAANDKSGGGHFSGRLTAPLCVAGGLCLQWLAQKGITVSARAISIHGVCDEDKMAAEIIAARNRGDSVGGVIECTVNGLPVGVGEPIFGGLENRISLAVFGIPAFKGIEFGLGFGSAEIYGSENNDSFYYDEAHEVKTHSNNCGGILGGISNGMPLVFRVAVKPTPSIALEQNSISFSKGENIKMTVGGRHDPCIVPRAVPCVEAAAALAIADLMKGN